jgi:hypothetical protein
MPLATGSTTVAVMAAATAASTAFPPAKSMRRPACAARGWLVATTLAAMTGERCEGYGKAMEVASMGGSA